MYIRTTLALATAVLALLTACGGAPAPAGSTPPAPVVTPPTVVVTPPPGAFPTGIAGDPELAAQFPTEVDGKPVTDLLVIRFVDYARSFGMEAAKIEAIRGAFANVGVDLEWVVYAHANASVFDGFVGILALRIPGQDASVMTPVLVQINTQNEGDVLTQETVGGKSVSVMRSEGGYASNWYYAHGDVLWSINTASQNEAEAVFSSLQ